MLMALEAATQDESSDVAARVVGCGQRLTGELRKPITAPCGSLTHLAAPAAIVLSPLQLFSREHGHFQRRCGA
jgi:hypothetical protein